WLKSTSLIPRYIGGSRNRTGDSPLCCRWNTYYPSLLFLSGESTTVRVYHPASL
ncbi:hypothetical protein HAX54_049658, partial [Datura stramonium]|nr:hypothetical protein [Datura stramonium]